MASCVSVLSSSNGPLFILSSDPSRTLADQYSLHTSLDVIEEKSSLWPPVAGGASSATPNAAANASSSSSSTASTTAPSAKKAAEHNRELYLGALFATEKQKVFGYVTNTRIKFILIIDSSHTSALRDNEIRQMFRKLHTAYTQVLSNPFYVPGTPIKSKRFDAVVRGLMASAPNATPAAVAAHQR